MSKKLLDMSDEILALEAQLEDEDLTDKQRQELIEDWLEAQGDATKKLDNYAAWIKSLEHYAEARRFHAQRMTALARADENRAERAKLALKEYFQRHKLERFKTPRFTIGLQANSKAPLIVPGAWEQDPQVAPAEFQRRKVELDKEAVRARVEEFCKQAELVMSAAENEEEQERLFKEWIEQNDWALTTKRLIEGCEIGERGQQIRIR